MNAKEAALTVLANITERSPRRLPLARFRPLLGIGYKDDYPDMAIWAALDKVLPREGWAIDVGANLGWYSKRLVERGLRTVAVEAESRNAAALRRNVPKLFSVFVAAASDSNGFANLNVSAYHTMHSLLNTPYVGHGQTKVRTITVDWLCDSLGLERVELLKIDVEGAEDKVVKGAARHLKRKSFRWIVVEAHRFAPDPANEILGCGYEIAMRRETDDAIRYIFAAGSTPR